MACHFSIFILDFGEILRIQGAVIGDGAVSSEVLDHRRYSFWEEGCCRVMFWAVSVETLDCSFVVLHSGGWGRVF